MIAENITRLKQELSNEVKLIIVSKNRTMEEVREAYNTGHRDFAENRVQALLEKVDQMPGDIRWHLIGHLQTNKVKYIAPFIHLIQSVDTPRLLEEIDRHAEKHGRVIDCLLQIYIATEETKFGMSIEECDAMLSSGLLDHLKHIRLRGLMGMATNTDDAEKVQSEFTALRNYFDKLKSKFNNEHFDTLSMGMSADYKIAMQCGSTMVRIGSSVFEG